MKVIYEVTLNIKENDIISVSEIKSQNIYLLFDNENIKNQYQFKFTSLKELNDNDSGILVFGINCDNLKNKKKSIYHKIKHIKRQKSYTNNIIQVIAFNYQKEHGNDIMDLVRAIKIQLLNTIEEKYDYIYDTVCNYLDNEFVSKNICDFIDNKCIAKRNTNVNCGCCRHYRNKKLALFSSELVQCEYLKDKQCSANCITCKLFTCDYIVKNKKIQFKIKDIFLLNNYFNHIQKVILLTNHFTTKEKIMKKLLKWR